MWTDRFVQSFNRMNKSCITEIQNMIKSKFRGLSGIVYCLSRKECDQVNQTWCINSCPLKLWNTNHQFEFNTPGTWNLWTHKWNTWHRNLVALSFDNLCVFLGLYCNHFSFLHRMSCYHFSFLHRMSCLVVELVFLISCSLQSDSWI